MKKIATFWNYFKKNEKEILNAILLGIDTEEVVAQLTKKLDFVSKRIGLVIKEPRAANAPFILIFTGNGYRKLFAKIIALEEQAPVLEHFTAQAFLKPLEDTTAYQNGTDEPFGCPNYEIKISEMQMALLDYNIATKQLKIDLYLPHFNELQQYEDLEANIEWIVMHIIGEIAYRKHIKAIELRQLPMEPSGLLSIMELPDFIAYLYSVNSRKKTRVV